jgi:hypothetical protein
VNPLVPGPRASGIWTVTPARATTGRRHTRPRDRPRVRSATSGPSSSSGLVPASASTCRDRPQPVSVRPGQRPAVSGVHQH